MSRIIANENLSMQSYYYSVVAVGVITVDGLNFESNFDQIKLTRSYALTATPTLPCTSYTVLA